MLQQAIKDDGKLLRDSITELMAGQFKHQYLGNSVKDETCARLEMNWRVELWPMEKEACLGIMR